MSAAGVIGVGSPIVDRLALVEGARILLEQVLLGVVIGDGAALGVEIADLMGSRAGHRGRLG